MMQSAIRLPFDQTFSLHGGETATRTSDAVTLRFPGPRNVLSTSWMNGGYRTDLVAVFNHQITLAACETCHAGNGSVQQYLEGVTQSLGLDPKTSTGLITRAEMRNTAIVAASFRDLTVTAIVTAGIEKNGGRAGDPASYYETGDSSEPVGGTINTILLISADLPEYTMTRAVMTAAEAKAVALQQLMARSIYSTGIATGSGTDMIVIVADPGSSRHLSNAGKHSTLGELIGRTVIAATTAALEMETGLSPASQADVLVRLLRFGVGEEDIWMIAAARHEEMIPGISLKEKFLDCLRKKSREPGLVAVVSAIIHIMDEVAWNLLSEHEAKTVACRLIREGFDLNFEIGGDDAGSILLCINTALSELVMREICTDNPEQTKDG